MAYKPTRIDKYERSALGNRAKQQMKERCQKLAEKYGASPPPKSRRGLLKLLAAKYGEETAHNILSGAEIPVPSGRKAYRTRRKPTSKDLVRLMVKYHEARDQQIKFLAMPYQPPKQPKTQAADYPLEFPPLPTDAEENRDGDGEVDADKIFERRPTL